MSEGYSVYVIFANPLDHPDHFVVRRWEIAPSVPAPLADINAAVCESLDDARAAVPQGLLNLGRSFFDDPAILEVWGQ